MRAFAYSSMVPAREGIRDGNEMENGIKEFIGGGKKVEAGGVLALDAGMMGDVLSIEFVVGRRDSPRGPVGPSRFSVTRGLGFAAAGRGAAPRRPEGETGKGIAPMNAGGRNEEREGNRY